MSLELTATTAGAAVLLVWILCGLGYARRLTRVLKLREDRLTREIRDLLACARRWEGVLAEGAHREWRESAPALSRVLRRVEEDVGIVARVRAAHSITPLLSQQEDLLAAHREDFPAVASQHAADLRTGLDRVERAFSDYYAAAADAIFLCGRFPLSALAALAGLRQPAL